MNIYKKINITESIRNNFKPTRLCIKKLEGIYYFCKSTRKDILKYSGSGIIWKARIKKYGKDKISTVWISDWYYTPDEIQDVAIHFSKENDIVNSEVWANLSPEWGIDSYTRFGIKEELITRLKKKIARIGNKNPMYGARGILSPHYGKKHTLDTKKKQSQGLKKYNLNRPKRHNDAISNALKGNKKLIDATTGYKNAAFKGWYVSPLGILFDSSRKAAIEAKIADKKTLIKWAKNNKNNWYFVSKENFCLIDRNKYAISK